MATTDTSNGVQRPLYLSEYQQQQRTSNGDYLGKDAFLKILMTQLQNQDPMNPMEDKDFIAQMAQFSTLEQMTNMASSFEKLATVQMQNQLIAYSEFVGKEVKWHKVTETIGEDGKPIIEEGTGTIKTVQFKDGTAVFILADGTKLEPGNISEISQPGTNAGGTPEQKPEELPGVIPDESEK